jgi:predicted esterase
MGTNDEYISNTEVEEQEKILTNNKIDFKSIRFEGKHEIPSAVLLGLSNEL